MEMEKRAALFTRLVQSAADRANEIQTNGADSAQIWVIGDDGYNMMERLAGSACVEDQLVAVALRLKDSCHYKRPTPFATLVEYFAVPALGIEIEGVRRSVLSEIEHNDLPFDCAEREVTRLVSGLVRTGKNCAEELKSYAAVYADLWCDPRVRATTAARRVMFAMVPCLADRARTVGSRVPSEVAPI